MATGERTVVKGVCPLDCPDTCSMRVTVEDGVAVDLRGDLEHPFTRGFLCKKMNHYLDRVYADDRLLHPLRRVGAKGGGAVRADRLGRGAGDDRRAVRRDREVGRRPAGDPAVQLLRDDGQAPGEQPRPAVLPPARGLEARPDHLRLGRIARVRVHRRPRQARRRPDGGRLVPVPRQLGLEHGQHQQPPLEPDGRRPARRRDDRHDRPLSEPDRREVRLAHRPPPRHRRRAGARGHARDLERGPARRRIPRTGDDRGPPAPRSRLERLSARSRGGHHGRRCRDDRGVRPPVCPRTALAHPPELRPPAPSRGRDGGADDRLPPRAGRAPGDTTAAGPCSRRAGPTTSTWIGSPAPTSPRRDAHDQHELAGRGPRRRAPRPPRPRPLRLQLPTRPPSPPTRSAWSRG